MGNLSIGYESSANWPIIHRKIDLDWSKVPLTWIYNDQFSSNLAHALSYMLVATEFAMCKVCNEALPYISDEKLRQDIKGFIRQEATHARAHEKHIEFINRYGINQSLSNKLVDFLLGNMLSNSPFGIKIPQRFSKGWLRSRAGFFSAAEHYTTGLANFLLNNGRWQENGCDQTMSHLLYWHAVEEIEHRTVMFDVFNGLGGNQRLKNANMMVFAPTFATGLMGSLMEINQLNINATAGEKYVWQAGFWRAWRKGAAASNVPSVGWLIEHSLSYFATDYNPANEGSTEQALTFLAELSQVSTVGAKA